MEDSIGAYLAQEVTRLASDSPDEGSPFIEDATADGNGLIVETELKDSGTAEEVDYFKLFDQHHINGAFKEEKASSTPVAKTDAQVDKKVDIAKSISAALGDTEELKVDVDAFWDDEGKPTTKRPQFNFDDLQFGTNLDDE